MPFVHSLAFIRATNVLSEPDTANDIHNPVSTKTRSEGLT